jgi:hypothetical protein
MDTTTSQNISQLSMNTEEARIASFNTTWDRWTNGIQSRYELAMDGFYYTGFGRIVKCAFCDFEYNVPITLDLHWAMHRRAERMCSFVRGRATENASYLHLDRTEDEIVDVTYESSSEEEEEGRDTVDTPTGPENSLNSQQRESSRRISRTPTLDCNHRAFITHRRVVELLRRSKTFCKYASVNSKLRDVTQRTADGTTIHPCNVTTNNRVVTLSRGFPKHRLIKPIHEEYINNYRRELSYERWPFKDFLTPQKMAEAGFFYINLYDVVCCYHCDGSLHRWQIGDDPWAIHAHTFPNCAYIYIKRGQHFIDQCEKNHTKKPPYEAVIASNENIVSRYTCSICFYNEVGAVLFPCDHAISCTDCTLRLKECPICKIPITKVSKLNLMT